MENITKIKKTFYDLMEMCDLIDKKLGYNQRDAGKHFYPNTTSFSEWCDNKNYGNADPNGRSRGSSQLWFAEYNQDIKDGIIEEVPYLDFWHWQLENTFGENFSNDSYCQVSVGIDFIKDDTPNWIREIQQVWHDTFISIADEDECVDIWVCW